MPNLFSFSVSGWIVLKFRRAFFLGRRKLPDKGRGRFSTTLLFNTTIDRVVADLASSPRFWNRESTSMECIVFCRCLLKRVCSCLTTAWRNKPKSDITLGANNLPLPNYDTQGTADFPHESERNIYFSDLDYLRSQSTFIYLSEHMGQHMCPRRVVLHACCLSLSLPFFFCTSVFFVTLDFWLVAFSVFPCNCCPAKTIILCVRSWQEAHKLRTNGQLEVSCCNVTNARNVIFQFLASY